VTLREDQLAVNQLAARSLKPSDITRVFISHFHADHIAALADFNKAAYVYLPQAYESVRHSPRLRAVARGFLSGLVPDDFETRSAPVDVNRPCILPSEFTPFVKGYDLLGDGSLLAVELPGHSAGQMGILARGFKDQTFFFVADAAWLAQAIYENRPPHAVANLLFNDPKAYRATLSSLHQLGMDHPVVHLIPSHCAETLASFNTQ
jgi:glyoxylase-like metal-dependent hydrolase (beta-lactamase superfamily II)